VHALGVTALDGFVRHHHDENLPVFEVHYDPCPYAHCCEIIDRETAPRGV
jgi:hypothetical protein